MTALVGVGLALAALVLFARLPATPKFLAVLNDAAHAPVFGALALVILASLRGHVSNRWRTTAAFVLTVLAGVGIEWIQGLIGRDAAWSDVRTDALGATCALGAAAWWHTRGDSDARSRTVGRASIAIAVVAGVVAALPIAESALSYARRTSVFPIIMQSKSPLDLYFIESRDALLERSELPAPWAAGFHTPTLLLHQLRGDFPGIEHIEPVPDWRGYQSLRLDVTNPASESLALTLRVHDAQHNQQYADRFNRRFEIPAKSREELSVRLVEIEDGPEGRKLDLGHVAGLIVFTSGAHVSAGQEFYVTRIWLE